MAVPVGKHLEVVVSRMLNGSELFLRVEGEVLGTVVDICHRVVLGHGVAVAEKIATGLKGQVPSSLSYHSLKNLSLNFHIFTMAISVLSPYVLCILLVRRKSP